MSPKHHTVKLSFSVNYFVTIVEPYYPMSHLDILQHLSAPSLVSERWQAHYLSEYATLSTQLLAFSGITVIKLCIKILYLINNVE